MGPWYLGEAENRLGHGGRRGWLWGVRSGVLLFSGRALARVGDPGLGCGGRASPCLLWGVVLQVCAGGSGWESPWGMIYYKPGALKPPTFILLQFWGSQVQDGSSELKCPVPSGGSRREAVPCIFSRLQSSPYVSKLTLQVSGLAGI